MGRIHCAVGRVGDGTIPHTPRCRVACIEKAPVRMRDRSGVYGGIALLCAYFTKYTLLLLYCAVLL